MISQKIWCRQSSSLFIFLRIGVHMQRFFILFTLPFPSFPLLSMKHEIFVLMSVHKLFVNDRWQIARTKCMREHCCSAPCTYSRVVETGAVCLVHERDHGKKKKISILFLIFFRFYRHLRPIIELIHTRYNW